MFHNCSHHYSLRFLTTYVSSKLLSATKRPVLDVTLIYPGNVEVTKGQDYSNSGIAVAVSTSLAAISFICVMIVIILVVILHKQRKQRTGMGDWSTTRVRS
jgi:hypothetical protein